MLPPQMSARTRHAAITMLILGVSVSTGLSPGPHRETMAQTSVDDAASDSRAVVATDSAPEPSRIVDSSGRPISGATIEFTTQLKYDWLEPPTPLATAVTNDRGEFNYPDSLPDLDRFFVIVNADGFMERFWTANSNAYLKVDGQRQADTLTLLRPVTVTGTILDEQGQPLPDADLAVDYYFESGPACINCIRVTSDENGRFSASNVPPANVLVRYESPSTDPTGEWPGPIGVQPARFCIESVNPSDGETIDVVIDLRTADRTVEGRVVDPDGQPLAGIAVNAGYVPAINRLDETIAVKTDAEGRFRFTGLTPDTFVIGLPSFGLYETVNLAEQQSTTVLLTRDPYRRGIEPAPESVEQTIWGEPNDAGLVAGLRLEPASDSYAIGDAITANVIVRNPTEETLTFDYSFSADANLDALDSQGNTLAQINYFHFSGLNAIFSYSLEAGQEAKVGAFTATLTAAGDTENSPPGGFVIPCPANERIMLRCSLFALRSEETWITGATPVPVKAD